LVFQFFTVTCHALVMCGRVRSTLGADQVAADVPWVNREQYTPRYNASPGASLAVLRVAGPGETSSSGRVVETMRFGLVPSYTDKAAKVDFYRMFNARSETIAEKGVFSRLLQRRRGVVLLNGFYEWSMEKAGASQVKQPYYLHLDGGRRRVRGRRASLRGAVRSMERR
jgi:putative SOS response-associated peptidase YedK